MPFSLSFRRKDLNIKLDMGTFKLLVDKLENNLYFPGPINATFCPQKNGSNGSSILSDLIIITFMKLTPKDENSLNFINQHVISILNSHPKLKNLEWTRGTFIDDERTYEPFDVAKLNITHPIAPPNKPDPEISEDLLHALTALNVKPMDIRNNFQHSLNQALRRLSIYGNIRFLDLLLNAGADVNSPSSPELRMTPLHIALTNNHYHFAIRLIMAGAQVTIPNAEGVTAYSMIEKIDIDLNGDNYMNKSLLYSAIDSRFPMLKQTPDGTTQEKPLIIQETPEDTHDNRAPKRLKKGLQN